MHQSSIALVLLLALTASQAIPHVNVVKSKPKPLIIGGEPAQEGEIPYQVGVVADVGGFCGGSLISELWVLTAGHCANGAASITNYLGSLKILEGTVRVSTEIIVHQGFAPEKPENDIALIKIPPVPLGGNIGYVSLVSANAGSLVNEKVRASGWGYEATGGTLSPVLRKVDLVVISNDDCKAAFGDIVTDSILCTAGDNVHAICAGDDGGPLVIRSGQQVAITNFASKDGCNGEGVPSGFIRISSYRDWILKTSRV